MRYKFRVKEIKKKDKELMKIFKKCKTCKIKKTIGEFQKRNLNDDGRVVNCKSCVKDKYKCICKFCGKSFGSARENGRYCSRKCQGKDSRKIIKFTCEYCKTDTETGITDYKNMVHKFCSKECKENYYSKRAEVDCDCCGKKYSQLISRLEKYDKHYCSSECKAIGSRNRIDCRCDNCGVRVNKIKSQYEKNNNNFCSMKCYGEWQSENKIGCNNHNYGKGENIKGVKNPNFGKKFSKERKDKISKSKLGRFTGKNSPLFKERVDVSCSYCGKLIEVTQYYINKYNNHYCSNECQFKWRSINLVGENSTAWNPELSQEERDNKRRILGYKEFRNEVYERDNYTCQCCGNNQGGNLNAHHLNGYDWDIENRINVDNGITLCEDCHKDFHRMYGYGKNTKEQFEEWIHNKLNKVS